MDTKNPEEVRDFEGRLHCIYREWLDKQAFQMCPFELQVFFIVSVRWKAQEGNIEMIRNSTAFCGLWCFWCACQVPLTVPVELVRAPRAA
jgi:hypothetical protein